MNYAMILGIFVGTFIGNLLAMYINNRKRKKKKQDGGCCTVCKYHALTPLMDKWTDENGTIYVAENLGYVCTHPKSGCKNVSPEFRCKYFRWCYK